MAASGMPYQCSMLVVPNLISSQALVSSTPAWWAMRQAEFVRLVLHGLHDVAVDAQNLDAVGAHLFERADAGAGLFGGAGAAEHGVDENAGRGNLALRALAAQLERALGVAAHVANGGDAAGQPDVQLVLDGLRLAAALLLQMGMGIDEAGEHVFAGGIDHGIGLCAATAAAPPHGDRIERNDIGDEIVLDQDVFGTAGGRAVAVHHDGVMDEQAAIAPCRWREPGRPPFRPARATAIEAQRKRCVMGRLCHNAPPIPTSVFWLLASAFTPSPGS